MRTLAVAMIFALATAAAAPLVAQSSPPPANATAAVSDPGRPAEDTARDANRKPAEMLVFADIGPGDQVADFIPGGGYFTRVFAKAVGPNGHVHALVPEQAANLYHFGDDAKKLAAAYPNVSADIVGMGAFNPNPKLDVFWTAQNYHDLHNEPGDVAAATNRVVFNALKPGGYYVVIDHVAAPGSGARDTKTLHRIDPALVRKEVEAAGFVFDGESNVLRNPADDHGKIVFDPSIRGKTDQFAYRFKKPTR